MDRKIAYSVKTRPIAVQPIKTKVDIIVPFHGNYKILLDLLKSIYRYTGHPYTITVVDDGSPSSKFHESFTKLPSLQYLRHETRCGFGASLYTGFKNTSNPLVLFLNSDCEIRSANWLDEMVATLYRMAAKDVRLVSATMNTSCGLGPKSICRKAGERCEDHIVEDALPLICTLLPRSLFGKIGGFVKAYPNPGYEDVELFHRMKRNGFKQAICGKGWVHHIGAVTLKSIYTPEEYSKILDENYNQCLRDLQN